jgi:hypothetical protein
MLRYFLVLAVTDGSLLAAAFVAGLLATNEPRGPHAVWRGVHVLVALTATMGTLAVHSIAYTYFLATGKWAAEVVRVYGLPTWINDQAKRNKRKAFRFEFWGMSAIAIAAWLGAGADAQGLNPLWHLAGAAAASAFNVVAFGVVYAVILQQARLLLEVKDQADRMRAARYGPDAAPAAVKSLPGDEEFV